MTKFVDIDALPPSAAITVPELAKILHVAEVTAWRWLKEGRIKSFKIGQSRRIRVAALRAAILSGEAS